MMHRKSELHFLFHQLPLTGRGPPKAYPTHRTDKWNVGYVRMPHSSHSLYPIERENAPREFRLRWEVIQEKLLQSFRSSAQLEAAVLSYNNKYAERWDFRALHHFFSEVLVILSLSPSLAFVERFTYFCHRSDCRGRGNELFLHEAITKDSSACASTTVARYRPDTSAEATHQRLPKLHSAPSRFVTGQRISVHVSATKLNESAIGVRRLSIH